MSRSIEPTNTTGALKRLQSRNFIARTVSPDDRRAQMCRLTASGKSLLAKMEVSARAAHRDTLASLSKTDQKTFVRMMKAIVAADADHSYPAEGMG